MRFLFPCLLLIIGCITPLERQTSAEENAVSWCQDMTYNCLAISCVGHDSDKDGYVSCTVALADSSRVPLECAYDTVSLESVALGQNTGCKETRAFNLTPSLPQ